MLLPYKEFAQSQQVPEQTFWTYTKPRIISIESNYFREHSMMPYLAELSKMVVYPYELDHRTVDNEKEFFQHLKCRTDCEPAPFYNIAFHGVPGAIFFDDNSGLGLDELVYPLQNGQKEDRIVYFSSCSVLQGEDGEILADHLLKDGKFNAVIGYTKNIRLFDALFIDLLFIHKFFSHDEPIKSIGEIYQEVIDQYKPAKECGFTLFRNVS